MVLMVHDSDPNVAKHALYTLKVGVKQYSLTPLEKIGSLASVVCELGMNVCYREPYKWLHFRDI